MFSIGIDLGGTRIKAVLFELREGKIIQQMMRPTTDESMASWKNKIKDLIGLLKKDAKISVEGIGISAPGVADQNHKSIFKMPGRLEGLEGFLWEDFLNEPTFVINDGQAAVLAEAHYGSISGIQHAILLTLGTGVGGGLWLNGKLVQGKYNFAGHFGHISLDSDSEEMGITNTVGSLEYAIGNHSIGKRSYHLYNDTEELVSAYKSGDPVASYVWLNSVRKLAIGISSLINCFSPEAVVLSGGIIKADEDLFKPLHQFLDIFEWRPQGEGVKILKAKYDEWSGAIGAAICGYDLTKNN